MQRLILLIHVYLATLLLASPVRGASAPAYVEEYSDIESAEVFEYQGTYYEVYAPGKCKIAAPINGSEYEGDVSIYSTIEYNGTTYVNSNHTTVFKNSAIKNFTCGLNPLDYIDDEVPSYFISLIYDADLEKISFLSPRRLLKNHSYDNINLGANTGCVDVKISQSDNGYILKVNKFNLFGPDGKQLKPRLILPYSDKVIAPNEYNEFHLDANFCYNGEYTYISNIVTFKFILVVLFGETEDGLFGSVRLEIPTTTSLENSISPTETPAVYYNLRGSEVGPDNLQPGVYIRRQGADSTKILIK